MIYYDLSKVFLLRNSKFNFLKIYMENWVILNSMIQITCFLIYVLITTNYCYFMTRFSYSTNQQKFFIFIIL